jgi:hypothetical protein
MVMDKKDGSPEDGSLKITYRTGERHVPVWLRLDKSHLWSVGRSTGGPNGPISYTPIR